MAEDRHDVHQQQPGSGSQSGQRNPNQSGQGNPSQGSHQNPFEKKSEHGNQPGQQTPKKDVQGGEREHQKTGTH